MKPKIEKVKPPMGGLIAKSFPRIDYADAYQVKLPDGYPSDVEAVTRSVFGSAPRFVGWMMSIRDHLVSFLGLKTAKGIDIAGITTLQPGASVGIFRVNARPGKS